VHAAQQGGHRKPDVTVECDSPLQVRPNPNAVHMEPGQEGARGSAGGAPQAGRDGGVRQPSAGAWAGGGNEWIREIAN
jgi:hypothetical protein